MVPPGGETQITATVNTKNRSGHQNKKVTVTSNDPVTPRLELRLKMDIIVDVEVRPRYINLGQLKRGEAASTEFTVKPDTTRGIKVLSLATNDERFSVEHLAGDPAGEARYRMDFAGTEEPGNLMAKLLIRYTGPEDKESESTIRANVLAPLSYPKTIHFVKAGKAFPQRRITISALPGENVRVEGVEDLDGMLELQILQKEGSQTVIQASVANPLEDFSTPKAGRVLVKTDNQELPNLEISYRIYTRRQAVPGR